MIAWHLFWFIGAGLIGCVIGWLWRKVSMSSFLKEYGAYEGKYNTLKAEHEKSLNHTVDTESKYNTLLADQSNQLSKIAGLNATIQDRSGKLKEQESYSASLGRQLESTKQQYVNLEKTMKSKDATIGILKDRSEVLKNQMETLDVRIKEVNDERQNLRVEVGQLEAYKTDFDQVLNARQTAESSLVNLEDELRHLKAQLSTVNSQLADQKVKFLACQDKNTSLKIQIDALTNFKQKYQSMIGNSEEASGKVEAMQEELTLAGSKNSILVEEVAFLTSRLEELEELKKKKNNLNTRIKTTVEAPATEPSQNGKPKKTQAKRVQETPVLILESSGKYAAKESEEQVLKRIQAKAKKIDFRHIGTAKPKNKEDLKLIKGIGPFLEKKVNALGIYTFAQIASFRKKDIEVVNDAIEFFPGRIERDDWVGQAKKLAKDDNVVLSRIRAKARDLDFKHIGTAEEKDKDDLKLIKGVGPFLERKINALNIYTFEQLSKLRKKDLRLVNNAIEFFPGRIERDDWVGQAKKLLKELKKPV